jgi:hypothetical protein
MKESELPRTMQKAMTTDWEPSMIGKKTCLIGRIRQEMGTASSTKSHFVEILDI